MSNNTIQNNNLVSTGTSTVSCDQVGSLTIANNFPTNKVVFSSDIFPDDIRMEMPWPTESDPYNVEEYTMGDIRALIEEKERQKRLRSESKALRDAWNNYQMCLKLIDNESPDK